MNYIWSLYFINGYLVWVWIALIFDIDCAFECSIPCILCTVYAVRCTLHRRRNSIYSDIKQSLFNGNRFEFQFRISRNQEHRVAKQENELQPKFSFYSFILLPQLLSRVIILKRRNVLRIVMAIYPCIAPFDEQIQWKELQTSPFQCKLKFFQVSYSPIKYQSPPFTGNNGRRMLIFKTSLRQSNKSVYLICFILEIIIIFIIVINFA